MSLIFRGEKQSKKQIETLIEKTDKLKNKNAKKQLERLESDGFVYWTEEERIKLMDEFDFAAEGLTGDAKKIAGVVLKIQRRITEHAGKHDSLTQKIVQDGGIYDPEKLSTIQDIEDRLEIVNNFKRSAEEFSAEVNKIPDLLKNGMEQISISKAAQRAAVQNTLTSYQYDKLVKIRKYDIQVAQLGIDTLTFLKKNFDQWEYKDSQVILATDEMVDFYNQKVTLLEETGAKQDMLIRDVLDTELRRKSKKN